MDWKRREFLIISWWNFISIFLEKKKLSLRKSGIPGKHRIFWLKGNKRKQATESYFRRKRKIKTNWTRKRPNDRCMRCMRCMRWTRFKMGIQTEGNEVSKPNWIRITHTLISHPDNYQTTLSKKLNPNERRENMNANQLAQHVVIIQTTIKETRKIVKVIKTHQQVNFRDHNTYERNKSSCFSSLRRKRRCQKPKYKANTKCQWDE